MVLAAAERAIDLPVPVLDRPHWRVVIRPERYIANRLDFSRLESTLDHAAVGLRGWYHPHIDTRPENQERGADYFATWVETDGHVEHVRIYQSGQVVHFFSFLEDSEARQRRGDEVAGHMRGMPEGFRPTGYVDFLNLLCRMTEIFEFTSRLAGRIAPDEKIVLEVSMKEVKDRLLLSLDSQRHWRSFCPVSVPELAYPAVSTSSSDLLASGHDHALKAAIWFYERFGWTRFDEAMLREEQRKFLNREW